MNAINNNCAIYNNDPNFIAGEDPLIRDSRQSFECSYELLR